MHDVADKVEVAEGNAGFQRVYRDAAVGPQHVVHVQLIDPLFALRLEGFRRRGEIRILVAEELVGNLAGQQNPDVGVLVNGPAAEIHAETGADGGDVPGAEQPDDFLQCSQNLFPGHMKRGMLRSDVVRGDPGIPEVDGVQIHPDGEGPDLPAEKPGGNGADQARIQPA